MSIDVSTPGRWCGLAAVATWVGVVAGITSPLLGAVAVALAIIVAASGRRLAFVVVAVFVVAGSASGIAAGLRTSAISDAVIPDGPVRLVARLSEESTLRSYGRAVVKPTSLDGIAWDGPRLAVSGLDPAVPVGATVTLVGDLRPGVTRVRDETVAGVLRLDELVVVEPPTNPIVRIGNLVRGRVTSIYNGDAPTDGLVRGLLIGDTDMLAARDEENLRRSGLAHFIAVSGSNVAMFLVAWWFLTAPIATRPRLRVLVGFVGLAVFVVVTRWEPSVVRASVMAGILLAGGLVGIPFDAWMALGAAVTLLLLVSGHLALSVGFQLSVAATVGVLIAAAYASGRSPRWLVLPLTVTVGAQIAVAPVILWVFGTIPLVAPIANLDVGPLVTITTAVGALALLLPAVKPFVGFGASAILSIAGTASSGPQLGLLSSVVAAVGGLALFWSHTRPLGIAAVVLMLMWVMVAPSTWPEVPTVVVLDVGQGDAILLQDPTGSAVLIDGGSDPRVLDRALRRNGVGRLSLVVVSHGHMDHMGGLVELLAAGTADELWVPAHAPEASFLAEVVAAARRAGTVVREVSKGDRYVTASIRLEVLGPQRRYATESDGSVVLWVTAGRSVLLVGDIEAVAQNELPPLRPDIMVVPHHGAGTTDLRWLERTVGDVAILSYGVNSYGHPHPDVVATLEAAGTEILRTDVRGDVVVPLAGVP